MTDGVSGPLVLLWVINSPESVINSDVILCLNRSLVIMVCGA